MRTALRLALFVAVLGLTAPAAPAARADNGLIVTATVDGASLPAADANDPLRLSPREDTVVAVAVTNRGGSPVEIRSVRLQARVLGLAFFSYTTRVDLTVAPGQTGTRTFALDLSDLDGQATGLLPAELALIGPDRGVVARETGTVDVRGKLTSVYGVFGLAIAGVTGLLVLALLLGLVRRSLPDNRWARALRVAVPGVGVGMVATFSLSVLRIAVPSLGLSLGLLGGGLLIGFVLGWLTPAPGDEADRDELDERDLVTVAPTPARGTAPVSNPVPTTPLPPVPLVPAPLPPEPPDDPRRTRVDGPPPPPEPPDDPRRTRVVGPPPPPTA